MARPADPKIVHLMTLVATNLVRFRRLAKLTQEQAGHAIGSTGQQLARWERGDSWINPGHLKLLADKYQRPVDHFYLERPPWIES